VTLFEPCLAAIIEAIQQQMATAIVPVTVRRSLAVFFFLLTFFKAVMLVGGFAASDWLFSSLQSHLEGIGLRFSRPDGHLCVVLIAFRSAIMTFGLRGKAVAEGAVSFQLDHFVSVRVARTTYGKDCAVPLDMTNLQHIRRSHTILTYPSGNKVVPDAFDVILAKVCPSAPNTQHTLITSRVLAFPRKQSFGGRIIEKRRFSHHGVQSLLILWPTEGAI
jgi:hypothetical protein